MSPVPVGPRPLEDWSVAVISKWAFQRLIAEMSDTHYEEMIRALQHARMSFPGWTDRLSAELTDRLPVEAVRFEVSLKEMSRALSLADTATRSDYIGDAKGGIWFEATEGQVRVSGTDDHAAAFMDLDASVDVPGTVVVEPRDALQITDALRKALPRRGRDAARLSIETEGNSRVRLTVGGRSHRSRVKGRVTAEPAMPPRASEPIQVEDGVALRRAIDHTAAATEQGVNRGSDPTDFDCIGVRATDGRVALDARTRSSAAQAHLSMTSHGNTDLEAMIYYLWLRRVGQTITTGPVQLGMVESETGKTLFMMAGPRWAAWTSGVTGWRERFAPTQEEPRVSVTFLRDDIHRFVVDAKRLAQSGTAGNNSWLLKMVISASSIDLMSVQDGEGAAIGALQVPISCQIAEPLTVHFHINGLLDALDPFPKHEVTLHIAKSRLAFITTAGYGPSDHPPALWATTTSKPRDPSHSPPPVA